jgi:predicted PurR-regulated permease PerM
MKKILLIVLLLGATNLFAQEQENLIKEIPTIKDNVFQQRKEINALKRKLNNQNNALNKQNKTIETLQSESNSLNASIDSLNRLIKTNESNITLIAEDLGTKIQETEQNANSKISDLDDSLSKNRLSWIIATLVILLLGVLMYLFLGKRIASSKTDVETQIRNTKASLEEESVKLDNKLLEVLETQLKLKQEESKSQPSISNEKADHSLALKVADEIVRMQKNLIQMDEKTKGLKQLNSSVQRIQDNFAANGYELVEMLGKDYNEGLKATVNFVQDEDFEDGKRIITRIIKPQVNYKGTMIQTAQIEVTEA